MKVDIIYRCCGKESTRETMRLSRPHWFDKRVCFKSVWDMTASDPATFSIHVIHDGESSALLDYIRFMRVSDGAIYCVNYGSTKSLDYQWDYADTLTGDWIYFVEDDYLHSPDAARVLLEGATKFDLLSLYDHSDRYTRSDDRTTGKDTVTLSHSCHWRTAESTTSTWATSRKLWNEIKDTARKHCANDRQFFYDLIERAIRLWTPIPARSTHCLNGYMSPLVNWSDVAAKVHL